MKNSRIFSKGELDALDKREKGIKADPTGVYHARVKPKIIELLEVWFPKKKALKKTIEAKK